MNWQAARVATLVTVAVLSLLPYSTVQCSALKGKKGFKVV